jgi:hypothetical protein
VYRFADKYGANVDGYSPIYTPDRWTESGDSYKLGTKGLIAWWVPCKAAWPGPGVSGVSSAGLAAPLHGHGRRCAAHTTCPLPLRSPALLLFLLASSSRAGLVLVLLSIGVNLIISTSQLGS